MINNKMGHYKNKNVINYPYIDYIIKRYVPEIKTESKKKTYVDMSLFEEAMTHVSAKNNLCEKTYERLEYLGDAIFHLVITDYFYRRYDEEAEGFLTSLRIRIERGDSMAQLSTILGLNEFVQIRNINIDDHILEDIFEAFIGAFYLSFGIKYTKIFIVKLVETYKDLSEMINHDDNYKGLLLRYFHQKKWGHPKYIEKKETVGGKYSTGSKTSAKRVKFISIVKNPKNKTIGKGIATSKKKAEQIASYSALKNVGIIVDGDIDSDWVSKIDKTECSKKKDCNDKKPMPILNKKNRLMSISDIRTLLEYYNVSLPKQSNINIRLFYEAMTHRSYLTRKNLCLEDKKAPKNVVKLQKKSNERLKFLGGSVIHFTIGELLYHKYKDCDEGFLTRLRCKLENHESLYDLAVKTGISSYLLISQNIEVLHGRANVRIIGGGFESFIGALYLQLGLSKSSEFLSEVIRLELDIEKIAEKETNYKDLILHLYTRKRWGKPDYRIINESGPDHKKVFTMGIYLNNKLMGKGKASNKKKAEQIASKIMFTKYNKK